MLNIKILLFDAITCWGLQGSRSQKVTEFEKFYTLDVEKLWSFRVVLWMVVVLS